MSDKIFTIGHGTRSLEEFGRILQAFGVRKLVDVRTVPRSRHNPQFNKDTLPGVLKSFKISYLHMPTLGGLRRPEKDSINGAWRNASFRGFADYMQTKGFSRALGRLIGLAKGRTVAFMCAESVPWRCHRSLIADALAARGWDVEHIYSAAGAKPHRMTPWARKKGGRIFYPEAK
ncbi:MAG: DUF488 domain-containing protein [Candidatus Omnitrophica bacterium]|nr:DUF488 domain-containing protein [Candidatus Omnitrophota bacterium]